MVIAGQLLPGAGVRETYRGHEGTFSGEGRILKFGGGSSCSC